MEVKQSYQSMNASLRKELRNSLEEKTEKYKLKDLSVTTFLGKFGMKHQFSAFDFALAIQALMDPPYVSDSQGDLHKKYFATAIRNIG